MQQEMKAGDDMGQYSKEPLPVLVIDENVLSGVAAGGDVVERAGKFDAQRTGHRAEYSSS